MKMVLIDHYDSFTNNVIDWLVGDGQHGRLECVAWDRPAAIAAALAGATALVLSPGPKHPSDAPATMNLLERYSGVLPILGICLGHQMLAAASGAQVVRGIAPHHGATREIHVQPMTPGLLQGLQPRFRAATYNSLVIEAKTLPDIWQINGLCSFGEIQAISCERPGQAPAFGLQFHPESFLSEGAAVIRRNWFNAAGSTVP